MTPSSHGAASLRELDDETRMLVRLAAIITAGDETEIRAAMSTALGAIRSEWVEELVLQTYLFAGFPRALNAMREWRRLEPAVATDQSIGGTSVLRLQGEETCGKVYGSMYERLRENIRALHPMLDDWMITEGYGKVLSRPELDLGRRELCIVAACAASKQDRQLHSHLHGALNVGVERAAIDSALESIADVLGEARARSVRLLWARVRGK
jgi:4-carboxymuconolactone decarboxylase